MTTSPSPAELDELDTVLTKAFNAFYNYITERDIVKAAHEYSEKTVYKEAKSALLAYTDKRVVEVLEAVITDVLREGGEEIYWGNGQTIVLDRLARLKAKHKGGSDA